MMLHFPLHFQMLIIMDAIMDNTVCKFQRFCIYHSTLVTYLSPHILLQTIQPVSTNDGAFLIAP